MSDKPEPIKKDDKTKKGEEGADELAELKKKLELTEKEKDEYLGGWRRSKADFLNYKNEEMGRLEEVVKYGNEEIIKELISVLESFDLASQNFKDTMSFKDGIMRIRDQLQEILKRRGLQKIEVNEGALFNPACHEVVAQEESDKPPDTVLKELSAGYTLHGKVIRASKVRVSK